MKMLIWIKVCYFILSHITPGNILNKEERSEMLEIVGISVCVCLKALDYNTARYFTLNRPREMKQEKWLKFANH